MDTLRDFSADTFLDFVERAMLRLAWRTVWRFAAAAGIFWAAGGVTTYAHHQQTDDLLGDNPTYAPFNLELRPIATMPTDQYNIISMTTRFGDSRPYVTTQQGSVFTLNPNPDGTRTPALWFNATNTATGGVSMTSGNGTGAVQGGLQSITFHPQFDQVGMPGYGKLYATMVRSHSTTANFLGNTPRAATAPDGVLAEWTYDHGAGTFGGFRELFRVNMPRNDHPIKQARFNPYAEPGDEDYGLLYMTHGDSNTQESTEDYPLYLDNALGKMIRIDPLDPDGAGSARYSIPTTNPFYNYAGPAPVGHVTVLGEIFAYGLRNPHTFSFNNDDNGNTHILNGNIGRANIEEVNLIRPGNSYGWPDHEGTFVHLQSAGGTATAGYITGVTALPASEAGLMDGYGRPNTYPVAQYDHNATVNQTSSKSSIASGFVIRNGSDPNLHNQLVFNNFPDHDSLVYHADFDEILAAVDQLDPNDPSRDEPSELTQATLHKLRLALDHDNDPSTAQQMFDDFNSLLADTRNDTRYGEGVFGEMYISTKRNGGVVYLVTNSVPLSGDFNQDRVVDAADYTVWRDTLGSAGYHLAADGNGDGRVDDADFGVWTSHFGQTWGTTPGSGAVSVPEPAAAATFLLGGILVVLRRKCRTFAHQKISRCVIAMCSKRNPCSKPLRAAARRTSRA